MKSYMVDSIRELSLKEREVGSISDLAVTMSVQKRKGK